MYNIKNCSNTKTRKYSTRKSTLCTLSRPCLLFASKYSSFLEGSCEMGIGVFTFQAKGQRWSEKGEEINYNLR